MQDVGGRTRRESPGDAPLGVAVAPERGSRHDDVEADRLRGGRLERALVLDHHRLRSGRDAGTRNVASPMPPTAAGFVPGFAVRS